jgi:hypothetical protein
VARKQGTATGRLESYEKAVALGLSTPGRGCVWGSCSERRDDRRTRGAPFQRAADLGGRSAAGDDARRLLAETP